MGWIKIAHAQYERKACHYSTELTGEESGLWRRLSPLPDSLAARTGLIYVKS